MESKENSKIDFSSFFVVILIVLLTISATGGWFTPHYSHWKEFDDCKLLEGTVVDKGYYSTSCFGEWCYYDYYIVVQDEHQNNHTLHVSPIIFTSHSIGGSFDSFYC